MFFRLSVRFVFNFVLCVILVGSVCGDDWSQWRGPGRQARSAETGLLKSWPDEGPRLVWKAAGLGDGYAGVVVSKGKVHTIGRRGDEVFAFAYRADDGQVVWEQQIGTTTRIPSSTPTADGDRLYVLDPDGELMCLSAVTGKLQWERSFSAEFAGRLQSGRGYGESPLIDGDRIICTPGGADATMVALNKLTGKVVWKAAIPSLGDNGRDGAGFSSIVVSNAAGVRQYVQLAGRGLIGIRAKDGKFLWGYNGIANRTANIPTPVVHNEYIFSANGYNAGSVLLKLSADGNGGVKAAEVYRLSGSRFQNHHGGYLFRDGHIFGGHGSNNGLPTCIELKTGRVVWKRRGPGVGSAAVLYADDHLYFKYQDGVIALIEASSSRYRLKSKFRLPGTAGDSWAHPALANGRLYLREKDRMFAYQLRGTTELATSPSQRPALTGALVGLHGLGLKVTSLSRPEIASASDRKHWYRFALDDSSPRIRRLVLNEKHVSGQGEIDAQVIGLLRSMTEPYILSLAGTRVGDRGMRQLKELRLMVGLDLEFCRQVTDAGFFKLASSESIRTLMLTGTNVTASGLRPFVKSKLRALDLEVCEKIGDEACGVLAKLTTLRALNVKKTGFEKVRVTNEGLRSLSRMTALEALNLYGNGVNDQGMSHLQSLSSLRYLNLSLVAITDAGLSELVALKQLRHLDLLFTEGFAGPVITSKSLSTIKQFSHLRTLNLTRARLTDETVVALAGLRQLRKLNLANTQISAAGRQRLQQLLPHCEIK